LYINSNALLYCQFSCRMLQGKHSYELWVMISVYIQTVMKGSNDKSFGFQLQRKYLRQSIC
jgi:hypothetical protein